MPPKRKTSKKKKADLLPPYDQPVYDLVDPSDDEEGESEFVYKPKLGSGYDSDQEAPTEDRDSDSEYEVEGTLQSDSDKPPVSKKAAPKKKAASKKGKKKK